MLPEITSVDFDGYILACGTDVRVGNTVIADKTVSLSSIEECAALAAAKGMTFVPEGENIAVRIPGGAENWPCPNADSFESFREIYGSNAVINKFSILNPCTDDIIAAAEKNGFEYIDHIKTGEFVPKGFSKVTGMKLVLEYFGADVSESIAFGDSMNDYGMICFAGTGVAMGNAVAPLKALADFVTESVSNDGIAYYINNVLLK